jgi:hypothetical protein
LQLNAPVHEVCRRNCDFLIQAAYREPYPVLLAILFGVEASYLAGRPVSSAVNSWLTAG